MAVCRRGMLHTWDFGRRFGGGRAHVGRAPIAARACLALKGLEVGCGHPALLLLAESEGTVEQREP